jgi:NhaP-type Na+/H+ or K+/H+ antiporter
MMLLLLLFGGMLAAGLLEGIGWEEITFAAVMLLIIRPLAGWISLTGIKRPKLELAIIAFFGIRGLGSVYYLSYGFNHAEFDHEYSLWGTLGLTIAASILMHGVLVTPALNRLSGHYRRLGIVEESGEGNRDDASAETKAGSGSRVEAPAAAGWEKDPAVQRSWDTLMRRVRQTGDDGDADGRDEGEPRLPPTGY